MKDKSDVLGYMSDGSVSSYYEPIENYLKLSGAYVGSMSQSTLSISIYSSSEEGMSEIGNIEIYADDGQYYFGEIVPVGENVYEVVADMGTEVILVEAASSGGITLQLYIDGEYVDVCQMVEHYES